MNLSYFYNGPDTIIYVIDKDKSKPINLLWLALFCNKPDAVASLLSTGASATQELPEKVLPLHFAICHRNKREIINLLLEYGADINALDPEGRTPLANAIFFGVHSVGSLLLDKKADPTLTDNQGKNALHYAAYKKQAGIITRLLQADPDLMKPDNQQNTPLHDTFDNPDHDGPTAYQAKVFTTIQALLRAKPSPDVLHAKDKDGKTALALAQERLLPPVVAALQAAGTTE